MPSIQSKINPIRDFLKNKKSPPPFLPCKRARQWHLRACSNYRQDQIFVNFLKSTRPKNRLQWQENSGVSICSGSKLMNLVIKDLSKLKIDLETELKEFS